MKKYTVRTYSRGMNEPYDIEFDTYKEAKKYYDEYSSMYYGDVECHLIKMKYLETSEYWVDCD